MFSNKKELSIFFDKSLNDFLKIEEEDLEVKIKQDIEMISVRDENISVNSRYLICQECNMQFHDPSFDPLKEAYGGL